MNTKPQSSSLAGDPRFLGVLKILDRLRSRALQACLSSGIGRLLVFLLASLSVRCLLDYWLHFAWGARVGLLTIDLVILGWIVWRYLLRPLKAKFQRESVALRLQSYAPELRSQVIATVQLVPKADAGEAPRSLVEKLLEQTAAALSKVDWKEAVSLKSCNRWLIAAGALAIGFVGWGISFPQASSVLVARYFLSTRPPIQDTQIAVLSGDMKVPRGGRVELTVELSGVIPEEVGFFLDEGGGSRDPIRVRAATSVPNRFTLPVENLQDDFVYSVAGGDAISREYSVEVLEPPVVEELVFELRPPAYTGVAPYEAPANALEVIEGSEISLRGRATLPLSRGTAELTKRSPGGRASEGNSVAAQALSVDAFQFAGDLGRLKSDYGTIAVSLVSTEGIQSVDNTRHAIEWKLDAPPRIEVRAAPEDESTVATGRPVAIEGQVSDDYAVSGLRFVWSMADQESSNVIPVPVGDSGRFNFRIVVGPRATNSDAVWLKSEPGAVINWRFEAEDNSRLARGPQITETPLRRLVVVTPEEKIAELLELVSENISTIEEASERQEAAEIRLRELMDQSKVPNSN